MYAEFDGHYQAASLYYLTASLYILLKTEKKWKLQIPSTWFTV